MLLWIKQREEELANLAGGKNCKLFKLSGGERVEEWDVGRQKYYNKIKRRGIKEESFIYKTFSPKNMGVWLGKRVGKKVYHLFPLQLLFT